MPNSVLPYAWMLSGALAFSVMATLSHALGASCHWLVIATARTGLALLFTLLMTLAAGGHLVFLRPATLWVRSIAGSVSLLCTFFALTRMPVADVLTLTNVFPIWIALLSWPVLGERPTGPTWAAIAVALVGVVLVEQPHFAEDQSLPAVMALVSSMSTAVSMLGLHRLQGIDPRAIVVHFSAVSLLACLGALGFASDANLSLGQFESRALSMLSGVGLCATIGQIYLTKAFAAGPPAKVSVVALTQVVFALVLEKLFGDHQFGVVTLAGMVLVMAPTAWLLVSQGQVLADDL